MQYLFLIYFDPNKPQEQKAAAPGQYTNWFQYTEALRAAGIHRGGEPLEEASSATSLRLKDAARVLTDGPFIETKEQLAGFYLVETESLDTALEWAGKMPEIQRGGVEVRPVMVFSPAPA